MILNDDYIYALENDYEVEPRAKECCCHCGERLFEGQDVVVDCLDNTFCDYGCAEEFHKIEEIDFDTCLVKPETCAVCGATLTPEYENFTDEDGEYYCSKECADDYHRISIDVL